MMRMRLFGLAGERAERNAAVEFNNICERNSTTNASDTRHGDDWTAVFSQQPCSSDSITGASARAVSIESATAGFSRGNAARRRS